MSSAINTSHIRTNNFMEIIMSMYNSNIQVMSMGASEMRDYRLLITANPAMSDAGICAIERCIGHVSTMVNNVIQQNNQIISHVIAADVQTMQQRHQPYVDTAITNIMNEIFNGLRAGINEANEIDPHTRPTTSEIRNATHRVQYSQLPTTQHTTCPITHEDFQPSDDVTVIRECGHVFMTPDINRWFETHHQCPVCRHSILETSRNVTRAMETPDTNERRPPVTGTTFVYSVPLRRHVSGTTHTETVPVSSSAPITQTSAPSTQTSAPSAPITQTSATSSEEQSTLDRMRLAYQSYLQNRPTRLEPILDEIDSIFGLNNDDE